MKITFVEIKNYRKLLSCRIDFDEKETLFVGANNSGKTSAMDALIVFLKDKSKFTTQDFTLSHWKEINEIGASWVEATEDTPADLSIAMWENFLPQLDVWIHVESSELHYINHLIPTLGWKGGLLGVRLRFEPKNITELYKEFLSTFKASRDTISAGKKGGKSTLKLWPKTMWDFLEKKLQAHFDIKSYLLDPTKYVDPTGGIAEPQKLQVDAEALDVLPFKGLIKIDVINAQRGFSDVNTDGSVSKVQGNLSSQLREYYSRHLDPSEQPGPEDIDALESIESARGSFDEKLRESFKSSLNELEGLNYPGFLNPTIEVVSKIGAIDGINHDSAVRFGLLKAVAGDDGAPLSLPEKYNGLGYQNLISMVFKLIRFRDEWMQVGKRGKKAATSSEEGGFEPLHLVLVEEPEAHLHAQIQQVFIAKAYQVLRNHASLKDLKKFTTQLVVSTHSSHIAHEMDFTCLRYFKRQNIAAARIPTSVVVNLSKTFGAKDDTTKFAIRYLKTTHCDLFFADAAILIEGPAERMLIPHFIKHHHEVLSSCFISILEIGGSYAHTLRPLIEDLGLITLVVTDLDSIDASSKESVFPEKGKGYLTGNSTIKSWLPKKEELDVVLAVKDDDKISNTFPVRVAYQYPVKVRLDTKDEEVCPYTFEDAMAFENVALFKGLKGKGLVKKFADAFASTDSQVVANALYTALRTGKKAEFALELLYLNDPKSLVPPKYIAEGLQWLHGKLAENKSNIA